eukprot:2509810-Pleurochrysis_carterae.AAC.2
MLVQALKARASAGFKRRSAVADPKSRDAFHVICVVLDTCARAQRNCDDHNSPLAVNNKKK